MVKFLDDQEKYNGQKNPRPFKEWPVPRYSVHVTDPEINRLCGEMIVWANITDCCRATSLIGEFEIEVDKFYEWCNRYPQLAMAYKAVKLKIAEKREVGVLAGKYNPAFVLATLPVYCPEYAAWRKELAAVKDKAAGSSGTTVNVSMQKMPETDVVPVKAYGGQDGDSEE